MSNRRTGNATLLSLTDFERLTGIFFSETSDTKVDDTKVSDGSGGASDRLSIADRIQALQGQGLSLSAKPKRFSVTTSSPRSYPSSLVPKSPVSLPSAIQSLNSNHQPRQFPSSPPQVPSSVSSPLTFVSTASLGPPSPTSSVASSPPSVDVNNAIPTTVTSAASLPSSPKSSRHVIYSTRTESEFMTAFPTIDELDEQISFPAVPTEEPRNTLPNVPLSKPGESLPPPPSSARDLRSFVTNNFSPHNTGASSSSITSPTRLSTIDRNPPHHRPSSTPIPPLANGIGHLDSPPERSPITSQRRELPSPPVASTSSHQNYNYSTKTPIKHASSGGSKSKTDLPVTSTIYPKLLKDYCSAGRKILLLDIRTRAEFDMERIKGDEIVCLEPSILTRDKYGFVFICSIT